MYSTDHHFNPLSKDLAESGIDAERFSTLECCSYRTSGSLHETFKSLRWDKCLTLLHINARSLTRNIEAILDMLSTLQMKPSCLLISETWLNDTKLAPDIPGYTFVGNNRRNKIGGGTGVYILDRISYKVRNDFQDQNNYLETTIIEIILADRNVLVGCAYSAPNINHSDFLEAIENLMQNITRENKTSFIGGDLNVNLLSFGSVNQVNHFVDLMISNKMIPTISKPTRVTGESETLIDNIFTNTNKIISSGIILNNDISDHFPLFNITHVQIDTPNPQTKQPSKPHITCDRTAKFSAYLAQYFHNFNQIIDVDEACDNIINGVQAKISTFFPAKPCSRKTSHKQPWMTPALLTSVNRKNTLYKLYLKNRNNHSLLQYKEYKNILTKLIRSAKKHYYQTQLDKHRDDGKRTWDVLKEILGTKAKSQSPQCLMTEGGVTTNRDEICEIFNNFFVEIGPKINASVHTNDCDPLSFIPPNSNSIFMIPTDEHEVKTIIAEMRQTSSGEDELSVSIIKALSQPLSKPLAHVINLSMTQGRFPNKLKSAIVIPIFKKGDSTHAENYRPISILSNISKIFEKVMYKRIYNFLESHNIISDTQFGFRQNHSTEHALIHFVDFVTKALEDDQHSVGVYLDTKKAFDSVNHSLLLKKLIKYGIRGKCAELIEDYLKGRTQKVKIGNSLSTPKDITCGIPQGSVLGPLLFIVYINDLNSISQNLKIITFADDTNIFLSDSKYENLELKMNTELQLVKTWFECNKLKLNIDKTCFQVFTKQKLTELPALNLDDIAIKHSSTVKFLGLYVDSHLTFKAHIKKLCTKLCQIAGIIRSAGRYLGKNHKLLLYNCLVLPHISYCCLLWGINYDSNLQCILKMQKRLARTILGLNYRDSVTHRFKDIGMLSIYSIVTYKSIIFAHKHINNAKPKILKDLLKVRAPNVTRNLDTFDVPFTRHIYRKHTSRFFVPEAWNKLLQPCKLGMDVKLTTIKNNVKTHLLLTQYQNT